MKNSIYIATSIDGYIASPDGGLDWLEEIPNPENSDYGFNDFMNTIDAVVMGKNTFEKVLSFGSWPYEKKVFVLSNSLVSLPDSVSGEVEILHGHIPSIVSKLKAKGYSSLYIDGGRTIQSFLQFDLIDEMIITKVPILLGKGIPLFGSMDARIQFTVLEATQIHEDLVQIHYRRKRE